MRKITQKAINAFMNKENYSKDNTQVFSIDGMSKLFLHGHNIATIYPDNHIAICNCGWFTTTTKERLNGIPGVRIVQKKGTWYLNGNEWDGSWTTI